MLSSIKLHKSGLAPLFFTMVTIILTIAQTFLLLNILTIWPVASSKVIFCDVGQGDALLIQQGFTQVLVDAGPSPTKLFTCLNRHIPWFDSRLDLAVATHPDFDHIGAFQAVMSRFSISEVMLVEDAKSSDGFQSFREAVLTKNSQGTKLTFPTEGDTGSITSSIEYLVLSPQDDAGANSTKSLLPSVFSPTLTETTLSDALALHEQHINNYNDGSISLILDIDGVKIMLTGDIEEATERAIERSNMLTKVNILKVAHHGAKTSSTASLLAKVTPEQSIISAGVDNKYGHPTNEVITRLEQLQSQIWRTDLQGEIRVQIRDGEYQITSQK